MNVYAIGGGVVLLVAISAGTYLAGSKSGYNEAVAKYNAEVAEITEQALNEQRGLNEQHQREVSKYVESRQESFKKMSSLQTRLNRAQSNQASMGGDNCNFVSPDVVGVFNEAINSAALPDNPDKPDIVETTSETERYLLYCIGEYNRVSEQLKTLIVTVE